jgi:hypothetical protein
MGRRPDGLLRIGEPIGDAGFTVARLKKGKRKGMNGLLDSADGTGI